MSKGHLERRNPCLADTSFRFDQSQCLIGSQNWKVKQPCQGLKKCCRYFSNCVSVQSVQILQFFPPNFFICVFNPPVNVWHTAILSKTNVVILCCCICVYWAMAVLFSDRFGYKFSLNYTSCEVLKHEMDGF